MATRSSRKPEPAPEMRECRDCRQSIPAAAKKCPFCQSYQNWERYLSFGASVLSLPVAVVAVLSVTLPAAVNRLRVGTADPKVYYLSEDGGTLSMAVENKGWGPLLVETVKLLPESYGVTPVELPLEMDAAAAGSRLVRDGDISVISMAARPEVLTDLQRRALTQLLARPIRSGDGDLLAPEIVRCKLAVGSRGLHDKTYLTLEPVQGCRLLLSRLYGSAVGQTPAAPPAASPR